MWYISLAQIIATCTSKLGPHNPVAADVTKMNDSLSVKVLNLESSFKYSKAFPFTNY